MDSRDLKILSILQKNGATPIAELAEAVGLSSTPCWRRVQKLQDEGVIRHHVVLCDAAKLNVGVTVFASVRTNQHSDAWVKKFVQATRDIPEIVEIYRMSGDIDYLLKIVVPDIAGYDAVYKRLIRSVELQDVSSSFAMEVLKSTTALPLHYVD
ncbi:MAG: Lrp/AsnC family transcriptional regulator [Pseudomonadota bacterium]